MDGKKKISQDVRKKVIAELVDKIPPLPWILKNVINLSFYEEVPISKIAEEISKDPDLAGGILRFANSRLFSIQKVSTIEHAIILLGTKNIARIAIAFWVKRLQDKNLVGYLHRKNELAIQSFVGAYATKRVCDFSEPSISQVAFAGAVLRNIGKLFLDFFVYSSREGILSQLYEGQDMVEAENEVLGISFPEVSYLVAQTWELPDDIKIPLRYFKKPDLLPKDTPQFIREITYAIHVGDIIAQMTGVGAGFDNMLEKFSKRSFEVLKIDDEVISAILSETFVKVELIIDEFFEDMNQQKGL